ncbi:hypothetical protein [Constantimarinum furrinae]|uniref:Lipoprotein n=1 Tax=Constantimarinum furrinae TaxID=2562285 RepID=A0A7G8PS71_9FLAO|nr:hypothetical protein [Constantimarinum furrinae]QNJ97187.1 hypothetical protein ALE3EI_0609 [Constantimarinum furrinae]
MRTLKTLLLFFFFVATLSCSKDDGPGTQAEQFANFNSQICNTVQGPDALYWDYAHGLPIPLAEPPLIANPGAQFIHSQYPALGFTMPQGYTATEVLDQQTATIGVNVIRNDNAAVWRYVPTSTFPGPVAINDLMAFEINQIMAFHGFSGNPQVLCTTTKTTNNGDLITTFGARLIQFDNTTALVWANSHVSQSLNVTFMAASVSSGPTAEFDALVFETFLPISWQLLVGPERIQDSDLDGVPDEQDNFPFDPNRQ